MNKRNISREKAKRLFNTTVNNHELSAKSAKKVYLDCGYTRSEAIKLSKLTAKVPKGSFYELITKMERVLIENYQRALCIKNHRYHDGIVVSMESINFNHITIPTHMDGYTYHVSIHNDDSDYEGLTNNIPTSSRNTIDNYESLLNKIL